MDSEALKILDKLIRCWSDWDSNEGYYLHTLIPSIVDSSASLTDREKHILAELGTWLSAEEWGKLSTLIEQRRAERLHEEEQRHAERLRREEQRQAEKIRRKKEERVQRSKEALKAQQHKSTAQPVTSSNRKGKQGANSNTDKVKSVTRAAQAEQSSSLEQFRAMDFVQLRKFIDESRKKLSEPEPPEWPRSKNDFLALWEILRQKVDTQDLSSIAPSQWGSPSLPDFQESKHLQFLRGQLKDLKGTLRDKRKDPHATKRSIKKVQHRVDALAEEIKSRERDEQAEYMEEYERWKRRVEIVKRVGKDIESTFAHTLTPQYRRILPWQILPPGELSIDTIRRHYRELQRLNPHVRYEGDRITKAYSLSPDQCYFGKDEFTGYMVLTFTHTKKALLECPISGNAIYIINSDWQRLSRLTKQELLLRGPQEVTRIVHSGDWYRRVKQELEISR